MIRTFALILLLAGCAANPKAVRLSDRIDAGMPWFIEFRCADGDFLRHCPLR